MLAKVRVTVTQKGLEPVTVTFEGVNARNEAIGYCDAMRSCGYWSEDTQDVLSVVTVREAKA